MRHNRRQAIGKTEAEDLLSRPAEERESIEFLYSAARNRPEPGGMAHFCPLARDEIHDFSMDYATIFMCYMSKIKRQYFHASPHFSNNVAHRASESGKSCFVRTT